MSNYDLQAEVSRLRSELNSIERRNAELRSEIGVAVAAIAAAEASLINTRNAINTGLADTDNSLNQSHMRVIQAYEIQQEIDTTYARLKNMELANKKIRRCNNTKYYDFEVYRRVRKIVQGMMDNLDFSMISDRLIESAVEKKHLEQPNYWLTSTLIAVCAWKNDQKKRAYRSLDQALKFDRKKTASFLLVFNLRLGREDAAFKWFDDLTQSSWMGSDQSMILLFFSLLSKTIEDEVSDGARAKVSGYMRDLIRQEIDCSALSKEETIAKISAVFQTFADDFSFPYPAITKHVQTAEGLKTSIALARNNAKVINFINSTMNVDEARRNEFLKEYIDEIVSDPCPDEASVYEEIERNELIIKYQGDLDAAAEAFEASKTHDESEFDILDEMMNWIYTVEGRGESNPQMRKNMMILTRELQQDAGDRYIDFYRGLFKSESEVTIDDYQGPVDLTHVDHSDSAVESFYHAKAATEKAAVKNTPAFISFGVGAALIIAAFFVAIPLAAIGVVALLAGLVIMLINTSKKKGIDLAREQNIRNVKNVLADIGKEYKQLEADYRKEDILSGELQKVLASL